MQKNKHVFAEKIGRDGRQTVLYRSTKSRALTDGKSIKDALKTVIAGIFFAEVRHGVSAVDISAFVEASNSFVYDFYVNTIGKGSDAGLRRAVGRFATGLAKDGTIVKDEQTRLYYSVREE